jgi:transcriptional regulator with XRE-family HTH domain
MALAVSDMREVVERVCARPDVLEACGHRDLGVVIEVLGAHGLTQGQIAALTGISQGRLSEYRNHKRRPTASSIFEAFADGLRMPPTARRALGLSPDPAVASVVALPSTPSPDVGLVYPHAPAEGSDNLARLWRADLGGAPLLQARLDPAAWNDASLRWLIDRSRQPDSEMARGVRIGTADVDRFRTTVNLFTQLDDRFGGGHARQALVQYLSTDADRLLHGRFSDSVGRALFSATAEATLLAAWMSYDSAPGSSLAQRYFIQALALAQAGNDRLLGASILDAMSHQATYTGRFGEAADLARAAMTGSQGIATATLTAHFHAMEARALARMGDAKGCDRSLAEAISEFERRRPDDDPAWIRYFDESELSAEFGHCLRDLGRATGAAEYASRSLAAVDESAFMRSDFFAMMVLADAYLDAGEQEQACSVALKALTAGEQIRSARCVKYLNEFHQRLTAKGISRSAAEFYEQAARSRLWRIASRPDKSAA